MPPELAASALVIIITLCYVTLCAVSPFGNCRRCGGLGFKLKTSRAGKPRRGKNCRRCRATGRRLRVGRRAYNLATAIHRDGIR